MQIDFELPGPVDEERLNREVMPVGYVSEQISDHKFYVRTEDNLVNVGRCDLAEPFVKVTFFMLVPEGRDFLSAFGRRFPEHNPTTLFYGFVYQSPNGLFQLDKTPLRMKNVALKEAKNYASSGNTYFVSFYRGDWTDEALKVISMSEILPDASLGAEKGPRVLVLEKERNK